MGGLGRGRSWRFWDFLVGMGSQSVLGDVGGRGSSPFVGIGHVGFWPLGEGEGIEREYGR